MNREDLAEKIQFLTKRTLEFANRHDERVYNSLMEKKETMENEDPEYLQEKAEFEWEAYYDIK